MANIPGTEEALAAQNASMHPGDVRAAKEDKQAHEAALSLAEEEARALDVALKDAQARRAMRTFAVERTDEDIATIFQYLCRDGKLRRALGLRTGADGKKPDELSEQLCRALQLLKVPMASLLYKQGDSGDSVYIVASGSVAVLHRPPSLPVAQPPPPEAVVEELKRRNAAVVPTPVPDSELPAGPGFELHAAPEAAEGAGVAAESGALGQRVASVADALKLGNWIGAARNGYLPAPRPR